MRGYLNDNGLYLAYKAIVRLKLEYGSLTYWSTAKTNLIKLDQIKQQAQGVFGGLAVKSLEQRREAATVGLTCRLFLGNVKQPLETLTPEYRTLVKEGSGGPPDWEDTSNSTKISYSVS